MKIEKQMIDKQLRIYGSISKVLLKINSEEDFIKLNKKLSLLQGKKIKGLDCSEKWIKRSKDNTKIRICIYKPLTIKSNALGLLWLHGGGFATGVPEISNDLIKKFVERSGCVVIAPDYTLSLDKPYPAALEDCHEALLWMKNNAQELQINPDQLMVGGESAGGGLTAAITLYERDIKGVSIAFQMPLYPMIDDRMNTESAKNNNAPVWDSKANKIAWNLYLKDVEKNNVPIYAAPARAINYDDLPPIVTYVGDLEPFRDETIAYVKKLKEANVSVKFKVFQGCFHAFDKMYSYAKVSKEAIDFLMQEFDYARENYFAKQN